MSRSSEPRNISGHIGVVCAGSLAISGLFFQWHSYLNHDVSWILYSSRKMLDGAIFGRDILAANPPLAWFLALPAAAAAKYLHFDPIDTFRSLVAALCAGVLIFAHLQQRSAAGASVRFERAGLMIMLAYFLFLGCVRDFGQREHLALAAAIPYLLITAGRLQGEAPSLPIAALIGVIAGLGLALKPHFLAVPVLVELAGVLYRRQLAFVWRPETVAIVGTLIAYAALVPLLTPAYLTEAIPLFQGIYWGFSHELLAVVQRAGPEIVGLFLAAYWCRRNGGAPLQLVLVAAGFGFLASYLLQQKGYGYHLLPLRTVVAISLAMHFAAALRRASRDQRWRPIMPSLLACAAIVGFQVNTAVRWYADGTWKLGPPAQVIADVVEVVDRHAKGKTFIALSTHPFPGFPTALYAQAEWVGRTNSQIMVPAIVKMRAAGMTSGDSRLSQLEAQARHMFRHDLQSGAPALVLVDARPLRHAIGGLPFDFLEFYLDDPETLRMWRRYLEMPPVDGFRVFLRRSDG